MAFGNATKGYVKKHSGGGGGGGTTNYSELSNKPQINGVTLDGNKTSEDLNIGGGGGMTVTDITSSITTNLTDVSQYSLLLITCTVTNTNRIFRDSVIINRTDIHDQMITSFQLNSENNCGVIYYASGNLVKINKFSGDGDIYKVYGIK